MMEAFQSLCDMTIIYNAPTAVTNLFTGKDKMEALLDRGKLFYQKTEGGIWFTVQEDQILRLYYASDSLEGLDIMLQQLNISLPGIPVTDIVGMDRQIQKIIQHFLNRGFTVHSLYQRMMRLIDQIAGAAIGGGVGYATAGQAMHIYNTITAQFDPLSDHLPSFDEISQAINEKRILVVKKEQSIGGFLVFDRAGSTSTLNYWHVDKDFRGQGAGAKLIKGYFNESRGVRRLLLWVNRSNGSAIEIYRHYGYREDGLIDQIMIKRNKL